MMRVSTVVVDDEPLARKRLRDLLHEHEDLDVVGEAADGEAALAMIRDVRPDLLFLDVQMPVVDGFDVVRRLEPRSRPLIVFSTAFGHYALEAFRASAVQYLMKPVDREELRGALDRVRGIQAHKAEVLAAEEVSRLLADLQRRRSAATKFVVKSPGRTFVVDVSRIDWIEAAGNYVSVRVGDRTHLLRRTMAEMEGRLDPAQFVRVHRSTIVNVERVRELRPSASHGDFDILLQDGSRLTLSRAYRDRVEALLGVL